jgi:hypothetical protein
MPGSFDERSFTIEYPANGSFFRPQKTLFLLKPARVEAEKRSVQGAIARSYQPSADSLQ